MKIGVSIVTCDRPKYLELCINSLEGMYDELVIVNNGNQSFQEYFTRSYGCKWIEGNKSNSPHGQNLGFEYLVNKNCDFILKSDDDLKYLPGYISKLVDVILTYKDEVVAVGGVCWSAPRSEIIHRIGNDWFTPEKKKVTPQFMMYRIQSPNLISVNYLHGGFLYKVQDALVLREKTKHLRGGVFGEYFSPIAYREETEFSFLLKVISGKKLILNPNAQSYHYYAKGGIRRFSNMAELERKDELSVMNILNKLNIEIQFDNPFDEELLK